MVIHANFKKMRNDLTVIPHYTSNRRIRAFAKRLGEIVTINLPTRITEALESSRNQYFVLVMVII